MLNKGKIYAIDFVSNVLTEESIKSIFRMNCNLRRDASSAVNLELPCSIIHQWG
jgi:ABC-type cobalamin/Fe3+-siderophores transport system ATPase subunit